MKTKWCSAAVLCALWMQASAATPAGVQLGLVQRGQHLAELICGSCHQVARDQEFPPFLNAHTPSFYEIAARPGIDARTLRHFITTTHWDEKTIPMTMPNQQLTAEELTAVVAYILSLKPPAGAVNSRPSSSVYGASRKKT